MERRSTRNCSVRDRERSVSLAANRTASTDVAPKERNKKTRQGTQEARVVESREGSADTNHTDETDLSSDRSTPVPEDATNTVVISVTKKSKISEKIIVDTLSKKNLTLPSQINLEPGQIYLQFDDEKNATQVMSAFNQKMFGKRKNMKYSSKNILSEKNLFLYFKLKSGNELEEIHLLYEGEEKAVIYNDTDYKKNLLDAVGNLKSAQKKWKLTGVFVCPKSYYLLTELLESDMEGSPIFHRWTDVLSCLRLQKDPDDLKFFSHDPNMLTKISGQSIRPGTESNIVADIFVNLNTKDIRECSLRQRKYEFVMFGAEFEKINTDRIIQVHILGRSNSSLDIAVSMDSGKEYKRSLKSGKALVNIDEGSGRIVEFLRAAASEAGSLLVINSKGRDNIGWLLNILCSGKGWSQIREILKGFLNFEDVWKQFTPAELQKSYQENIDKSWKDLIPLRKKIMEHLVGREGEVIEKSHALYSNWMNQVLEENVRKRNFKIFDPLVHQLLLRKKLHLPKDQVGSVTLEMFARYSWLEDAQFSIEADHPDIEVVTELVTLEDKKEVITVDVKNTSGVDIKMPAKTQFGLAKLKEKSESSNDIDIYLLSSDEEEEEEEEEEEGEGRGEKRKALADVGSLKRARISLGDSCNAEMITSLDEFKLKLSPDDAESESCITGNTTPEILKTTGTNQFLTDLKESLDKSFDIGDDFDVGEAIHEIDSVESIQDLDFRSEGEVCRVGSPEVQPDAATEKKSDYKKSSEFSAREVTSDGPLIAQLQSLARLLAPVPLPEGLTEHFPSLLSHGDLTTLCQTLAKYGIFTKGCLDFELCDFGDKLIYELSNLEGSNLADLKTVMQEFNKSQPRADLELWTRMFSEKYESFLGINDILGEHFDLKTVQLILLHFAPQFEEQDDVREDPVTSLKYFSDPTLSHSLDLEQEPTDSLVCADLLREEKILHYFDARTGRENIYLGLRSGHGEEKKIMIVKDQQLLPLNLSKDSILGDDDEDDEDDCYLVHVTEHAGCNLAISLSSWDQPGQTLLHTGFVLFYSSSQECHVALIEAGSLKVVVVDPTVMMIMLENNVRLPAAGSEVKLIINTNLQPLLCLVHPDTQKYDLHDVSKWSGESTSFIANVENLPEIQDLVRSLQITRLQTRLFLLIKCSDSDKLLKVQQIILKKSNGLKNHSVENYMHSHKHRQIMPANVLASKEDLLDLKFLMLFTNTSVELLNKVIIVEGDCIENINLVKKSLNFNLKKSKSSNRAAARKEFLEIKSGQEISLGEKEKKSFAISIAAEDINLSQYKVHMHFDFDCFKNDLVSTVKIDAENAEKITLELGNVSKRKILLSRDQNVLLLERKSSSKVSSKKKHVFPLKLIKTVNMPAKSVSFVECVVVDNFKPMTEKIHKIHRHPDFKNKNIFLPDKQMRTISPSGKVKISLRNKTSSALELPEGSIIGEIITRD